VREVGPARAVRKSRSDEEVNVTNMRRTNTEEISIQWVGCVVSERYYGRELRED
jgi:hypothetical protein